MEMGLKVRNFLLNIHGHLVNYYWITAVVYQKRLDDENQPPSKRYIHEISSKDGVNMIITMLPGLAQRVHFANATLHDNTYKRVFGDWKEWEVVIWDQRLNMRSSNRF
jgi:hypothetical protein